MPIAMLMHPCEMSERLRAQFSRTSQAQHSVAEDEKEQALKEHHQIRPSAPLMDWRASAILAATAIPDS